MLPSKFFMLRILSLLISPIVRIYVKKRINVGLEDRDRYVERFGKPSKARPHGKIFWIHAVSVGESISAIPIVRMLKKECPELNILFTTTTKTSAQIVQTRLDNEVIHQYMPFDIYCWAKRFVDYWKPEKVFFIESEIWPNILSILRKKHIEVNLLNVRISSKSLKRMCFINKIFGIKPFSLFDNIYAPSKDVRDHVIKLGGKNVSVLPNMKTLASKLEHNAKTVELIKSKIKNLRVWMAVSTHKGEEEIIIETHNKLEDEFNDILTIIAIRHPSRVEELEKLCIQNNIKYELHSNISNIYNIESGILIVDQIGKLGDYFEVAKVVHVCGSLIPGIGGHNILEPIKSGCTVATGKYIENFIDIYAYVQDVCVIATTSDEIYRFVKCSFIKPTQRNKEIDFENIWSETVKSWCPRRDSNPRPQD